MNIFDGEVKGGAIEVAGQLRIYTARTHLADIPDGPYRFGIRASDCRLRAGAGLSGTPWVAVRARVELSEISGSETFVYLRAIDQRTASGEGGRPPSIDLGVQYIVQRDGVYHHRLDDELTFYLDPGRLLAFRRDGEQALVASYRT
jgi:glycerol transport system ATP-binding protein